MRYGVQAAGAAAAFLMASAVLAVGAFGQGTVEIGAAVQLSALRAASGLPHKHAKKTRRSSHIHVLRRNGDLRSFLEKLRPGDVGKLAPGVYGSRLKLALVRTGTAAAPIRLTSLDPVHPATIAARIVFQRGADHWVVDHLDLDWNARGQNYPSITIGSEHVTLRYDDIQNQNTSICINAIDDPSWGTAKYTLIDHNRIHNCGVRPVTSYSSSGYFAHGIYVIGYYTTITNNYIYDNANRGIQLRGSHGAVVEHNTIDGNGSGIIFGDLAASGNTVAYNIITNSANACSGGCNSYGAFSWWGSTATGSANSFHDNCVYGNQKGDIETSDGGFRALRNKIADPRYVNRARHDYSLAKGSPCASAGVQRDD